MQINVIYQCCWLEIADWRSMMSGDRLQRILV